MGKYGRLNGLIYCCIFGELQKVAYENGYSLAVHGSMNRDFDVIAIPWTEQAIPADDLINEFHRAIKAESQTEPTNKPHGRVAWFLCIGSGLGIDISVIPRNNIHEILEVLKELIKLNPNLIKVRELIKKYEAQE